ncbi:MAG: biotin/lipoyl-binding protein [Rubrivivax sp.]|jgi:putative peptide zinc metalloprotease protein
MSDTTLFHPEPLQPTVALLSPLWFRVARLCPRLDPGVRVQRAVVRGEVWTTLVRADGARSFRMTAAAWDIVGRFDGDMPLQRLWDAALQAQPDAAPTQGEVLEWLTRLQTSGFVSVDKLPDFGQRGDAPGQRPRLDAAERGDQPQSWMAWRVPLGRPDAMLAEWANRWGPLLRQAWLLPLLLLVVGHAAVLAVLNAGSLTVALSELASSPRGWWLALLVYPVIKLLHELAHGVVSRLHGAPVPQWGVTLLMLMPVPYVDASAASALPRAGQRLAVASAGILVEALLASAGLWLALASEPGWLRDLGLTVFFIGALSTLAVNGNPLLRFDGYHMLCDAADLPNLATRSQRWWQQRLAVWALGVRPAHPLPLAPGEARWLIAYTPLSLLMRWVVALAVLAWVATLSAPLAVAVGAALGWAMLGKPLWAATRFLGQSGLPPSRQRQRLVRLMLAIAVVLGLLVVVPVPHRTVVQGIWWPTEEALLRTQVDGFVAEVHATHGQAVKTGDRLLTLHTPALEAEVARLAAREQALVSEHWQALRDDPPKAVQLEQDMTSVRAELARAQSQRAERVLFARSDGVVAWPQEQDMPGRWLARGALVGHLVTTAPARVQVAIPHDEATAVSQARPRVELLRSDRVGTGDAVIGRWDGRWSAAGAQLPSAALAERHGGPIATDPQDPQSLKPLRAVALAEIRVEPPRGPSLPGRPSGHGTERIGERVWVRFDHGSLPLAAQAWQGLRRTLLKHLGTSP